MQWYRGSNHKAHRFIAYPLYDPLPYLSRLEKFILGAGFAGPVWCPVCGSLTVVSVQHANLRETCICVRCKSMNRQRQIAYVVCQVVSWLQKKRIRSLKQLARLTNMVVYNTEARGALHDALAPMKNYRCSEYYGEGYQPGVMVNGTAHEDLMNLSLPSESVDLVISSDVFEHIPNPYRAHEEVFRILKPRGRHIFTVPFYQTEFLDETRARLEGDGKVSFVKEPIYHEDPIRNGALVYTIFSVEMLCRLRRIGYRTNLYHLYKPGYGMFGPNGIVFEGIKDGQ